MSPSPSPDGSPSPCCGSEPPSNSSSNKLQIPLPLTKWINGAVYQFVNTNTPSSSSAPGQGVSVFLTPALKIAWCLANYICQAEASTTNNLEDAVKDAAVQLPAPSSDWADKIMVQLVSPNEMLINNPQSEDELAKKLTDDLNDLISGQEGVLSDDNSSSSQIPYLSVVGAQFALPDDDDKVNVNSGGINGTRLERMQRIHSLGLVLYKIFSGGENPNNTASAYNKNGNQGAIPELDIGNTLKLTDAFDDLGDIDDIFDEGGDESQTNGEKRAAIRVEENEMKLLRDKGIPDPLVALIGNMLDAIKCDLSGNETYSRMIDVACDLRLMLDKPGTFLYGIDVGRLSATGLQISETTIFGREREIATLQESYRRAKEGKREMAIISGMSGTGKTVIVQRLLSYIGNSCTILQGKFDQMKHCTPFSALAIAFNQYIDWLINNGGQNIVKTFKENLEALLGKDATELARLIPNLTSILGDTSGYQQKNQDYGLNSQKRVVYLLCLFVEVIAISSGTTVTFFLDDLQWADLSSIEVIKGLLLRSNNFYFLGAHRDELSDEHPVCSMMSQVVAFGINITSVKLECMNEEMLNSMVSDTLCLPPRLTKTLTHSVHHQTRGLPLYFSKLMLLLNQEGLLWLSLSKRRWEWDEEKIQSRQLPDDVASFFVSTIGKLPGASQAALSVLSCFGSRLKVSLVEILEEKLGMALIKPLDAASDAGFVEKIDGSFVFCHDEIQESSYSMIRPEEQCICHFKYGMAICSTMNLLDGSSMVFLAVDQINRGGPKAVDAANSSQFSLVANLNLLAGTKAMMMSDFASAHSFFDQGISFLRKNHWDDHYKLSLDLYNGAAKSAFAIGDLTSLTMVSAQIINRSKSIEDQLEVLYITVCALTYALKLPEAVEKARSILAQLGEHVPAIAAQADIMFQLSQTKVLLSKFNEDDFLGYRQMDDPLKLMAMKFYIRLQMMTQQIRPALQPICTMNMINLSLSHGMSPGTAFAFALYGCLLARLGEISDGYRYAKMALRLIERNGSQEVASQVILSCTQTICFVEPVQAAIERHREGYLLAMAAGSTNNAMLNSMFHEVCSFWAGTKLGLVKNGWDKLIRQYKQHQHLNYLALSTPVYRSILMLICGKEEEDSAMEVQMRLRNPHAAMSSYFQTSFRSFIFRDYDQAKSAVEKYLTYNLKSWNLVYVHAMQSYYVGLISFWIYRNTICHGSREATLWLERGQKSILEMKKWAESSNWNFIDKLHLLEAEEHFSFSNFEDASVSYSNAVTYSKKHKFINDEALSNELAGYCQLARSQNDSAITFFMQAHSLYNAWGASGKCNALFEFVNQTMSPAK